MKLKQVKSSMKDDKDYGARAIRNQLINVFLEDSEGKEYKELRDVLHKVGHG